VLWPKKPQLPPNVAQVLSAYGVDGVRSVLITDMGANQNSVLRLAGTDISRQQMQDWLKWKGGRTVLWNGIGIVAAVLAAIFSFIALFR
jgi:hypothetical protein